MMSEDKPRRLILVSNRLPYQLTRVDKSIILKQSDGGLVSALKSYFERESSREAFSELVWIGSADFPESRWNNYKKRGKDNTSAFTIEPLFIESKTYDRYYNGFCNATIWPLFHYFPSYAVLEEENFVQYENVNKLFAEKILSIMQEDDIIWVHDYQLFLLPELIREKMPKASIGFFLHIPFPTYEIFRLLHRSWKEKIVRGLLGADLIGFHTHEYVQHFLKTVRMVLGYDEQFRTITFGNRLVKADLFPLGIDYEKFNQAAQLPEVIAQKNDVLNSLSGKKIIFSVDRLDYTKGVTHRLSGFERFLEIYPEWRENVVFVLVVVPSRQIISKYNERREMIEGQVGRINGKYSTLSWQPIIYRYSTLSFEELSALYQVADVGLITPLRDGMNLVAKEYVASQGDRKGMLILSELAGAASEMGEALLINPTDKIEVAQAIHDALTMPEEEKKSKMSFMQKRLIEYDVLNWVNDFLQQLNTVKEQQQSRATKFVRGAVADQIIAAFRESDNRYLFLDYDGTLVPFAKHPKEARPNQNLLTLLEQLSSSERNKITIISGRDAAILEQWFGALPINLIAEHGASVRRIGETWRSETTIDQSWKQLIKPTMEMFVQRSPGSFLEEKSHTLAWHYRNVESELGFVRSRELLDNLYHMVKNIQLQVVDGNKVIEVRVAGIDKGIMAMKVLSEEQDERFVIAIGDDKTDEDMFRSLDSIAITIKVGAGPTVANYVLPSQDDVLKLLAQLVEEVEV